jgi:gliding motility-associated lipoprotein GldH
MRLAGIVLITLLLAGCTEEALINQTREVSNAKWAFDDPVKMSVDVLDTTSSYAYFIQLRHSGDYRYRNLIVYFKTFYPNNTYMVDTVDCPLAEPSGRWLGSGLGDILDNQILFKINQPFPISGTYNFEIQHAMRSDTVHEIYDMGLLIKKMND